ncbi:MAG: DUF4974 domain-containing protein [Tannerella sp.]|jgi:ferric-dicitrate binding protein FerR (iron transport regulator)|nr:DUF4974 domain-containing protein [Tannerella sp.]
MEHIIIKYLRGHASGEEEQSLLEWIRKSESNRKEFMEMRDLWITSGDGSALPGTSGSKAAFNRFRRTVAGYETAERRKKNRIQVLRYAASVALLMACSLGMYMLGGKNAKNEQAETIIHQTVVRNDKTAVVLPDGTKVWLNKDSKLSYPENFADKRRAVTLDGEGFFDVVRNESSPFIVETGGMTVKVLGTEFDVKSHAGAAVSEITLLSGNVEVSLKNNADPIALLPNQKISYNRQTDIHRIESIDAAEYALWKNEKLVMNNEELGTIFRKMARWYDVDIAYDHTLPLKAHYSITITDEPKEEILRLLSVITPIKYELENDKIIIKRK